MAFTVEGKDGTKFTADTIEELKQLVELSASSEEPSATSEEESPLLTSDQLKEGDKVRILTEPGNYMFGEFHRHVKGSIGTVTEVFSENSTYVEAPSSAKPSDLIIQRHSPRRLERVDSLGKDVNGEDLFEGDYVTGASGNGYTYTNDSVIMKVLLKEDAVGHGINADIGVEIVGEHRASIDSFEVQSERFIRLSGDLDEAKAKFSESKGEEVPKEDDLLPVGTKVRLLRSSSCGDLLEGEEGTITETDKYCEAGFGYKVRVRDGWKGYGWLRKDDVVAVEEKTFKVGDKVRVTGNSSGHELEMGDIREIYEVDTVEPKYNLSQLRHDFWANTSDIELVTDSEEFEVGDKVRVISAEDGTDSGYHGFSIGSTVEVVDVYGDGKIEAYDGVFYQTLLPPHFEKAGVEEDDPTEFRTGDLVRVTETFEDSHGDKALKGKVLEYDDAWPATFVGTILLQGNHDKIQLVCRKEDRKDIEL